MKNPFTVLNKTVFKYVSSRPFIQLKCLIRVRVGVDLKTAEHTRVDKEYIFHRLFFKSFIHSSTRSLIIKVPEKFVRGLM